MPDRGDRDLLPPWQSGKRSIAVAIPARNEADRLPACLDALAAQPGAARHIAGVVVFANNCTDATVAVARARRDTLPFPLTVIEATLPAHQAHVGWARHGALAAAALLADPGQTDGIIASTDADSHVQPGWLAALIAAFAAGADAVAGSIDLDPAEPGAVVPIRDLESRYAALTAELADAVDPVAHDAWPNHIWAWGANLAVRAPVLAALGGMPVVPLAEDRALHALLLRGDYRVRHSLQMRVWTSARHDGRAPGGLADLLRDYRRDAGALCDAALEPARMTLRRAVWRARARRAWATRDIAALSARLGCSPAATPTFGALWEAIETASPLLARQRLPLAALPAECRHLERLVARLKPALGPAAAAAGRSGSRGRATAPAASPMVRSPR